MIDLDKRIGAQYYTINSFCQTLEDFEESCKKVAAIGYKTVQLSGIGNFSAEEIKPILDKYNLQPICTHRGVNNYLENLDEEIVFHKTLGIEICGLGCMPGQDVSLEGIENFVKNFKPVAKKLEENGLVFAYHNHSFEFEKVDGRYAFDILLESFENLKLILDVYWLAFAGINPASFIRSHPDNVLCVHFKDLKIKGGNKQYMAEIGQGNLDWDDIITACEEADVKYAFVEQDICEGDPFDCLETSYKFLKTKGMN